MKLVSKWSKQTSTSPGLIPKPQYLGELRPEAATRNRKTQGERSWPLRARNQRLFQGDFKVISINF